MSKKQNDHLENQGEKHHLGMTHYNAMLSVLAACTALA